MDGWEVMSDNVPARFYLLAFLKSSIGTNDDDTMVNPFV